ncbi:NRDE-2, necessary for RNA interference-domain-containing protein [Gaertneriomyces semiglobifer]|nr:NRDE-2, necessary for RNA interference-domain-containing protein [Gaertneriomyces semiglobifer]
MTGGFVFPNFSTAANVANHKDPNHQLRPALPLASSAREDTQPNLDEKRARHRDSSPHVQRKDEKDVRKKRKRSKSRERHHKDKKRSSKKSAKDLDPTNELTFKKDGWTIESVDFFVDKKGDKYNAEYGSSHRYAAPTYKRWRDRLWGHATDVKIDYKASRRSQYAQLYDARPSDIGHGLGNLRYQDFKRILAEKPIRIKAGKPDKTLETPALDYIVFATDSFADLATETSERPDLQEDDEFRARSAQFNKRLQDEPRNPQLWQEFINMQDQLIRSQESKPGLRLAISEKKQAIYEKALKHLPDHEELLAEYMACCQETWETPKLLTKWDTVLKNHGQSFILWKQYLDFRQTNYSTFTVSGCIELYQSCMATLISDTQLSCEKKEPILLYVLTRACHTLQHAGFIERSVALFQAMVELCCFCPAAFGRQTLQQKLTMFEGFWDKDLPKFGEVGAKGWANSLLNEEEDGNGMTGQSGDQYLDEPDVFERWARQEAFEEYSHWLPYRGASDEDIEDPYRTILFEDIQPLLFDLQLNCSKVRLIYAFLQFLGVPFNEGLSSKHSYFEDCFVHGEFANATSAARFWPSGATLLLQTADTNQSEQREESGLVPPPLKIHPQTLNNTYGGASWFNIWTQNDASLLGQLGSGRREFVRNVIQQTQQIPDIQHEFQHLLVLFESRFSIKSAQKAAKGLLKNDRVNLSLWNAYAQTEVIKGNTAEAYKVYQTALLAQQSEDQLLYRMLADLRFADGDRTGALCTIVALSVKDPELRMDNPTQVSPTKVLRARNAFSQQLDVLLTSVDGKHLGRDEQRLLHIAHCYTLLEYLSQGLTEAQAIYVRALEILRARTQEPTVIEEALFEDYTRLVHTHATSGTAFKPAVLRDLLEDALERFPSNTIFLSLYNWNEARTKIDNRMRRRIDLHLKRHPTHVLWTFAIWAELHQRQNYNPHMVRSLFDRALECPTSRHSPSLWYLYISFEVRENDGQRAKALFFRAIRECPWCKGERPAPASPASDCG